MKDKRRQLTTKHYHFLIDLVADKLDEIESCGDEVEEDMIDHYEKLKDVLDALEHRR